MKGYSIGEVSRIVKMPVQTVRFLEEKGLISPARQPGNNYRRYEVEEINRLLNYRWYRDIGCSVKESIELVKDSDLFQFGARIAKVQHRVERQAYLYEQLALRLKSYSTVLEPETLASTIGVCTLANSPEMLCSFYASVLDESLDYIPADQRDQYFFEASYLPFTDLMFLIPMEKLAQDDSDVGITWGFAIENVWSEALGPHPFEGVKHILPARAFHTVLRVGSGDTIEGKIRSVILPCLEQKGYTVSGDVWGTLIVELREGCDTVQYLETWVPVNEKQR